MPARLTTEKFKENILKIHGNRYDLSKVVYEYAHIKVTVGCYEHGDFDIRPNSLQQGGGCPVCGDIRCRKSQTKSQEKFITEMKELYGDLLDFSESVYVKAKDKVSFVCPIHNTVKASPDKLKRGNGCPKCNRNGYSRGRPGSFYVLIHDDITKVGITNLTAEKRAQSVNCSSKKSFSVYLEFRHENGDFPKSIETITLKWLRSKYKKVDEKFDGHTECFQNVDRLKLIEFVSNLDSEYRA